VPKPLLPDALDAALTWHGDQHRKGKDVPYIAHLLGVASLVLEFGGNEEQAAAGLLHDALEDTDATVEDVRSRFGDAVASIVSACTDAAPDEDRGPSTSMLRKRRHVEHVPSIAPDAALVSACDKLHNLRDMVIDANSGAFDTSWPFNVTRDEQVSYYRGLIDALNCNPGVPAALVDEMRSLADRLERAL
jgi:(p)ppGpp synthase/HD superfamily hydrolase